MIYTIITVNTHGRNRNINKSIIITVENPEIRSQPLHLGQYVQGKINRGKNQAYTLYGNN